MIALINTKKLLTFKFINNGWTCTVIYKSPISYKHPLTFDQIFIFTIHAYKDMKTPTITASYATVNERDAMDMFISYIKKLDE